MNEKVHLNIGLPNGEDEAIFACGCCDNCFTGMSSINWNSIRTQAMMFAGIVRGTINESERLPFFCSLLFN